MPNQKDIWERITLASFASGACFFIDDSNAGIYLNPIQPANLAEEYTEPLKLTAELGYDEV